MSGRQVPNHYLSSVDRTESFRTAFEAELDRLHPGPGKLLVAVSGGPDSVALLDLLAGASAQRGLILVVGHVDHGIHPSSAMVAGGVRRLAAAYQLSLIERRLMLGSGTSETIARTARYAALEAMRREVGAELIVTAHHADDQAETVLMRTLRGSGPAGLAAMAPRRGRLLRPLLPFRRAELAQHLLQVGLTAWDDPANADSSHLRSWVRREVMPRLAERLPDVSDRLLEVAYQARVNRVAWDSLLDVLPNLDLRAEPEGISVSLKALEAVDDNLLTCLVMAICRRTGFSPGPARLDRVFNLIRQGRSGTQVPLGLDRMAERSFDRLRLIRSASPLPVSGALELAVPAGAADWSAWRFTWSVGPAPVRQDRAGTTAWFEAERLLVRACRSGDRLSPLGGRGRRLIVRCLQEARIPRSRRAGWPALEHQGTVVWVPGVCRSDRLVPVPGAEALRVDAELA
jgi:tRNA(Ile)-lysidine synthase